MKSPIQIVEDAFGRPVEQLLYGVGARLNVPWGALKGVDEVIDFTRAPIDYVARRRRARELVKRSPWKNYMSKDEGYCFIDPAKIPSLAPAVAAARKLQTSRSGEFVHEAKDKPFRAGILKHEDLKSEPALLEFALSREMIEIVTGYLGTIPRLAGVDLMYSAATVADPHGSQLWHLDKPEVNYVQCFVCLNDVGDENGPFTFLPAQSSSRVCRETGYHNRSSLGEGRLSDHEFDQHRGGDALVSLQGPVGSGVIIDSSRCLHFGARLKGGYRLLLGARYAPAHRIGINADRYFDRALAGGDPVRELLLTGGVTLPRGYGKPIPAADIG